MILIITALERGANNSKVMGSRKFPVFADFAETPILAIFFGPGAKPVMETPVEKDSNVLLPKKKERFGFSFIHSFIGFDTFFGRLCETVMEIGT